MQNMLYPPITVLLAIVAIAVMVLSTTSRYWGYRAAWWLCFTVLVLLVIGAVRHH
jgi:general stress protein CsbA